jgi:hypothetical protein
MSGPRTKGLVAVRNVDGLVLWLPRAIAGAPSTQVAAMYRRIAGLVLEPSVVLEVDRNGDVIPLPSCRDAA